MTIPFPRPPREREGNLYRKWLEAIARLLGVMPQVLFAEVPSTTNTAGVETTLASYSVPAYRLSRPGESLTYVISGAITNSVNTKTVRIKLGSTTLDTRSWSAGTARTFIYRADIARTSSSSAGISVVTGFENTSNVGFGSVVTLAEDWETPLTLSVTGESATGSSISLSYWRGLFLSTYIAL